MNKFDKLENCLDRKNKRIKILFDKYKNVFRLLCLIIILLVLWLLIHFYKYRFFKFIFLDRQGNFQWVGVTALIAIISLTVTAWDNRRKFKADLISKNRIKWLQYVRENAADFINDCFFYSEYSSIIKFFPSNVKVRPTKDGAEITADLDQRIEKSNYSEIVKDPELEKLRVSLNLNGNKMLLCFYNKKENKNIIDCIINILEIINKEELELKEKENIKRKSECLRNELSNYFKQEWERVKKGE